MLRNRNFLSKVLLVLFILSIVLTSALILCSLNHECIGEGCTICYEINLAKNIFSNLLILALLFIFSRVIIGSTRYLKNNVFFYYHLTPIELKVKISE